MFFDLIVAAIIVVLVVLVQNSWEASGYHKNCSCNHLWCTKQWGQNSHHLKNASLPAWFPCGINSEEVKDVNIIKWTVRRHVQTQNCNVGIELRLAFVSGIECWGLEHDTSRWVALSCQRSKANKGLGIIAVDKHNIKQSSRNVNWLVQLDSIESRLELLRTSLGWVKKKYPKNMFFFLFWQKS